MKGKKNKQVEDFQMSAAKQSRDGEQPSNHGDPDLRAGPFQLGPADRLGRLAGAPT